MSRALERRGTELARQRATVTYTDRRNRTQPGTLIYYPASTGSRPSAGAQARIRTPAGHYVNVDPGRVTLPEGGNPDPQPSTSTAQPSTLTRRSRVSVHELGPDGTLIARDVGAPPGPGPSTPHQAGPA
jgi:hypothetical protein